MNKLKHKQNGVALITVLLVVSLASIAAVSMTTRQQLDIRRTTNILKIEEAYAALLAAEEFAKRTLLADFRVIQGFSKQINTTTDGMSDIWNNQMLQTAKQQIGNFAVTDIKITDLQGRFNINNLVAGNQLNQAEYQRFQDLLDNYGLDNSLATAVLDWIDENQDGIAEDDAYMSLEPSYTPPNGFMASASEMYQLMGVNLKRSEDADKRNYEFRETIKRMFQEEAVIALRTPNNVITPVNVNTVQAAEVYQMIAEGLSLDDAENILSRSDPRFEETKDFWDLKEIKNLPSTQKSKNNPNSRMQISVKSEYFLLQAQATSGNLTVYTNTILHRTRGPDEVKVVHRSFSKQGEI